jgi:hypothetical protein
MNVADVRRMFRARLEDARRDAEARRVETDRAAKDYDNFLHAVAIPAFRMVASILSAEGYPFKVFTPAGGVRMASTTSREDYFEVELDADATPPQVIARANRAHAGRIITIENPLKSGVPIADLREEDVVDFVLAEIPRFV